MFVTSRLFSKMRGPIWEPKPGSRPPEAGSLPPHRSAVGGHIVIVFFDGVGESVMTCGVGDEIVIVALCGMHGRLQCALPRIADGARRKSRVSVGVVGRVEAHVVVVQRASVCSRQQFGIDY